MYTATTTPAYALPSPLAPSTNYYVIDNKANTFGLATSAGGSLIPITDTGSGSYTIGGVRIESVDTGTNLFTARKHGFRYDDVVQAANYSHEGKRIVIDGIGPTVRVPTGYNLNGTLNGTVKLSDIHDGEGVYEFTCNEGTPNAWNWKRCDVDLIMTFDHAAHTLFLEAWTGESGVQTDTIFNVYFPRLSGPVILGSLCDTEYQATHWKGSIRNPKFTVLG